VNTHGAVASSEVVLDGDFVGQRVRHVAGVEHGVVVGQQFGWLAGARVQVADAACHVVDGLV